MANDPRVPAQLIVHSSPAFIPSTQASFFTVTVENTSGYTWDPDDPHPVRLAYHWLNEQGRQVVFEGARSYLPGPLANGEQCQMSVRVHPPGQPGHYTLMLDIVREGLDWLNLQHPVQVESRAPTGRRAVVVNTNCLANDAVGNNLVRKLHLLRELGFTPLLLTSFLDRHLPLDIQSLAVEVEYDNIVYPTADVQWAADHFWQSELYMFEYPIYYPLVELIRLADSPIIFDYHGITPPDLWTSPHDRSNVELGQKHVRLVGYADLAIAHSEYTAEELVRTGVIERDRVHVIPYSVPVDIFRPDQPTDMVPGLEDRKGPVLLYVGRMAGNKRIDTMIRMVARVKQRYPDVQLLLVGDNTSIPYRSVVTKARELLVELGLENNVVFTGPRDHHELPAYFNACDLYVTSSLHEGFCIPVIEAMACGKPVVATAATALPSTVRDSGLLFEPENVDEFAAHVIRLLDAQARGARR